MMVAAIWHLPNKLHGVTSQTVYMLIFPQCSKKDRLKDCSLARVRFGLTAEGTKRLVKHENYIRKVPGSNLGNNVIILTESSQRGHEQIDLWPLLCNCYTTDNNYSPWFRKAVLFCHLTKHDTENRNQMLPTIKQWICSEEISPRRGFKKAYDSVRREVFYNILTEFGIPKKLIRLIKMCLTERYTESG